MRLIGPIHALYNPQLTVNDSILVSTDNGMVKLRVYV